MDGAENMFPAMDHFRDSLEKGEGREFTFYPKINYVVSYKARDAKCFFSLVS